MQHPHWHYFLTLSDDLARLSRFVEPVQNNFKTYSIEFARLYLAIGSEIDVVAKLLCSAIDPLKPVGGIKSYRPIILAKYSDLPNVEISIPRGQLILTPWSDWRVDKNPDWWRKYNDVKHERDKYFPDANLENTLNALAGLMVFIGYLYAEDLRDSRLPATLNFVRFSPKYFSGSSMGVEGALSGFRLPGIPQSPSLLKALAAMGKTPPTT